MKKLTYIVIASLVWASCGSTKKSASTVEQSKKMEIPPFEQTFFDALTQKSIGNKDKAYGLFRQCIEMDNSQPAPYYELARIDLEKDNPESAVTNAKIAVDKNPENEWYHAVLAEAYQKQAEYKNAISHYKKALALNPGNRTYYDKIIDNYSMLQDTSGALEYMNAKEDRFGVSEELSFAKYDLYLANGKIQQAEKELKKLINHYPDEIRYRGMLAEFYGSQGQKEKALEQYEIMREMEPENGLLHWQLGHHYISIGEKDPAFDEFVQAFKSPDIKASHKIDLIRAYQHDGDQQRANALIEIVKDTHPSNPEIQIMSGDLAMEKNDFASALNHYKKALEEDPANQDLWIKTLKLEYTLGEGILLKKDASKAANLFPVQPIVYLYKALGEILTGNYGEAKNTLSIGKEYVIGDDKLLGMFYEQQGIAAYRMGEDTRAEEYFQKALQKIPNEPHVLKSYWLYLLDKGQVDNVREALINLTNNRTNPEIEHVQAQLYSLEGNFQKGSNLFKRLLQDNPGYDVDAREHYGDLLKKQGKIAEAKKIWEDIFEKTGNQRILNKIDNL